MVFGRSALQRKPSISALFLIESVVGITRVFCTTPTLFTGLWTSSLSTLILLGLTLYGELIWLPQTKFGKKLIVQSTIAATSQPPLATQDNVIGKTAEAVTPLVPTGYVLVEGQRYEAFSPAGHVDKGELLRVSGLDNFRLIVILEN